MTAATMPSSPLHTKKRKHHPSTPDAISHKKSKKDRRKHTDAPISEVNKSDSSVKFKAKQKPLHEQSQEFTVTRSSLLVSIPPVFANNPSTGVEEMLDSLVMKHVPALRGVLLAHSNIEFLQQNATIEADSPFAITKILFDATVWSPRVGMTLTAKVNLFSPDHISLLIHRTFNVSIPRNHIPKDEYVFEYGPAENDPEFGAGADDFRMDIDEENQDAGDHIESVGKWVRQSTGERVGGHDGLIEFTVIGLTMVNQMISIVGSLQPDPFSPEYFTTPTTPITTSPSKPKHTEETSTSEDDAADRPSQSRQKNRYPESGTDDDDEDMLTAFENLRRQETERQRIMQEQEEKRKRKEARAKRKADSMEHNKNEGGKKEKKKKKRKVVES
ncbi:hypothetical protein FRC03_009668 [Tulasnella sp. 419]|nr:hypothetical protein FRC03_009668 [Tulasnella sp. 419]